MSLRRRCQHRSATHLRPLNSRCPRPPWSRLRRRRSTVIFNSWGGSTNGNLHPTPVPPAAQYGGRRITIPSGAGGLEPASRAATRERDGGGLEAAGGSRSEDHSWLRPTSCRRRPVSVAGRLSPAADAATRAPARAARSTLALPSLLPAAAAEARRDRESSSPIKPGTKVGVPNASGGAIAMSPSRHRQDRTGRQWRRSGPRQRQWTRQRTARRRRRVRAKKERAPDRIRTHAPESHPIPARAVLARHDRGTRDARRISTGRKYNHAAQLWIACRWRRPSGPGHSSVNDHKTIRNHHPSHVALWRSLQLLRIAQGRQLFHLYRNFPRHGCDAVLPIQLRRPSCREIPLTEPEPDSQGPSRWYSSNPRGNCLYFWTGRALSRT